MKSPKVDNSGAEAAAKAQAEAQAVANNLQKNFATDLKNANLTQVNAGGDANSVVQTETARRKKVQGGLASQLGINY